MSQFNRGYKDGANKKYNSPKRDGLLGTSLFESDKSRNKANAYDRGHSAGNKKRKSNLNSIQRLLD